MATISNKLFFGIDSLPHRMYQKVGFIEYRNWSKIYFLMEENTFHVLSDNILVIDP